jgi:hypothetical protein
MGNASPKKENSNIILPQFPGKAKAIQNYKF